VTGVGMHMTNHSFAIYSSMPQDINSVSPGSIANTSVEIAARADGPAVIVGYTVMYTKTDQYALAVCELASGARCYARCNDPAMVNSMEQDEWVGRGVQLCCDNGVNTISR
jgi:acetyl-CoA C-acetyltransferase